MFKKLAMKLAKKALKDPALLASVGYMVFKKYFEQIDEVEEREALAKKYNEKIDIPYVSEANEFTLLYQMLTLAFKLGGNVLVWLVAKKGNK